MDSKICLTCLCKASKVHNINEIIYENLKILEILHQLVPQYLEQKAITYPDTICAECLEKLVMSFKFLKQCVNSVRNLYKLLSETSSYNENPQKSTPAKLEDDTFEYETNGFNSNNDITMESIPALKRDSKMSTYETAIFPLTFKDPEIVELDNHANEEKYQKNAEDALCDKLLSKQNSSNNWQEKAKTKASEKPTVLANQCKICNKIFKQPQGLASHMSKTHFKKHLYQCKKCDKGFSMEELFIRHCNRHLGIKAFPCNQCDKAFDTRGTLNQHMLCHSKESSYVCSICGKTFYRADVYKQHMNRHDDREQYKCLKCARSFNSFSEHIKHIESHKNEKTHDGIKEIAMQSLNENTIIDMPLEQMLTEFNPENNDNNEMTTVEETESVEKLNVKLEKNEGGTENEFTIDEKTYSANIKNPESNDLTISSESAQCDLCSQIFKNSQGLARHRSSTHFKKHLYQCDQCDRGFSVEEYYIKHRNRHLGIKTFKCKQCDKAFETNSILNQHLISHSKLTPHLCTTCGKSFRRLDGLRQHMLRHGDERPFKCSFCPKSFKCHSDKLKHTLKHDEKRYECNICGSRLSTPESLSQHKMTHTGEKPFKCSYCDKSFISLSNMRCHERIHTGEKPYKCQFCWKSFRQSNDRKKHTKRVHKNEQNEKNLEENSS